MLLSLADNERFLEMFWACVLGAILPVPLVTGTTHEHRRKLFRVFAQFESAFVCMDAPALEHQGTFAAGHGLGVEMAKLRSRVVLGNSLDGTGEPGRVVEPDPGDAAFVQYSSGSTGEPKGVVLTHRNLATNIAAIAEAGEFSDRDLALSWMPLSHDMGLIGFHLNMLACGGRCSGSSSPASAARRCCARPTSATSTTSVSTRVGHRPSSTCRRSVSSSMAPSRFRPASAGAS